ncbi:MAG: Gfo/Idh/MocA family protein [Verrucomicrobiales bacterium]
MKDSPTSNQPALSQDSLDPTLSRRAFLRTSSRLTAGSALAGVAIPQVWAAGEEKVQLALVGCGGRGTGAAVQALNVTSLPTKLVAMADVSHNKLNESYSGLRNQFQNSPDKVDVPQERRFIGFDAFKNAMECLKAGDIVILTTPLAFRAPHFQQAIAKGLHVFMEKPVTGDGPTSRRMLELSKKADEKNLKCGVGLMVRHCKSRQELFKRIKDGEIGDLTFLRSYRMHGPVASCFSTRKPPEKNEVLWQIERFHSFLWASGGLFSDFYIHFIDECCWMKDAWPVRAHALGGRHFRGEYVDQNFDTYAVEYTFGDGTVFQFNGRTIIGCKDQSASYVHGTKGLGVVSHSGHTPGRCRTYKGFNMKRENELWAFPQPEPNPYDLEWEDLIDAIKNNKPYNEVPRGVEASVVTSMGRMAAHTGRDVTYDEMLNCPHEFAPGIDSLTEAGPAPILPNADGKYPQPEPGKKKDREY